MIKRLLIILISFLSITSYAQSDEKEILQTFEAYKKALLSENGTEAVRLIDSRTIDYYTEILSKVKYADSLEIASMNLLNKFTVLTVRHRAPQNEIFSFDGNSLFVYAIDNGMIGKDSVMNASLGEVTTTDEFAKAVFMVNKNETPFFFHFYKENDSWKIDLTHVFSIATIALKQIVEESGYTENEFIMLLLEMASGEKPNDDIWKALK